jgi:hypothetical protein
MASRRKTGAARGVPPAAAAAPAWTPRRAPGKAGLRYALKSPARARVRNSEFRVRYTRPMKALTVPPTLTDQVHQAILSDIAAGKLKPGARLIQEEIADVLHVSRQPVQQALLLLRNQGVLREAPGRRHPGRDRGAGLPPRGGVQRRARRPARARGHRPWPQGRGERFGRADDQRGHRVPLLHLRAVREPADRPHAGCAATGQSAWRASTWSRRRPT